MARRRDVDNYRPFPAKQRVSVRFFDLTCFWGVTERQKYGLVSNGFISYTLSAYT